MWVLDLVVLCLHSSTIVTSSCMHSDVLSEERQCWRSAELGDPTRPWWRVQLRLLTQKPKFLHQTMGCISPPIPHKIMGVIIHPGPNLWWLKGPRLQWANSWLNWISSPKSLKPMSLSARMFITLLNLEGGWTTMPTKLQINWKCLTTYCVPVRLGDLTIRPTLKPLI